VLDSAFREESFITNEEIHINACSLDMFEDFSIVVFLSLPVVGVELRWDDYGVSYGCNYYKGFCSLIHLN
jgi:hypothetical protein